MKWYSVKDSFKPPTLKVNYETEMSHKLLLWLKDGSFTVGWMVKDISTKKYSITWVGEVDLTRLVTHWTADVAIDWAMNTNPLEDEEWDKL